MSALPGLARAGHGRLSVWTRPPRWAALSLAWGGQGVWAVGQRLPAQDGPPGIIKTIFRKRSAKSLGLPLSRVGPFRPGPGGPWTHCPGWTDSGCPCPGVGRPGRASGLRPWIVGPGWATGHNQGYIQKASRYIPGSRRGREAGGLGLAAGDNQGHISKTTRSVSRTAPGSGLVGGFGWPQAIIKAIFLGRHIGRRFPARSRSIAAPQKT
jgi:hypothetical protein